MPDINPAISHYFFYTRAPGINEHTDVWYIVFIIAGILTVLAVIFLIIRYCLFRTDRIIDKFALDKNFTEEKFDFRIHRSSVLSIAIIVTGMIVFIDSFPSLCKLIYAYLGAKAAGPGLLFGNTPSNGWIIFYAVKSFLGIFLVLYTRPVVNFIELQRKKTVASEDAETTDPQ